MAQCRFLDSNGFCNCLAGERGKPLFCPGKCTMAQTKEQQVISLHKAWARFTALPVARQIMYKNLYYGGKYPWEVIRDDT